MRATTFRWAIWKNQKFEIDTIGSAIWWCSYNWYAQISSSNCHDDSL